MDKTYSRRSLIASLAAIGLVAAVPEPVKRYWRGHTFEPEPLHGDLMQMYRFSSVDGWTYEGRGIRLITHEQGPVTIPLTQLPSGAWQATVPDHLTVVGWNTATYRRKPIIL